MHLSSPLGRFLADRAGRSLFASFGLVVFSLGYYLQMQANIGLAPWPSLNQGLCGYIPLSFGTITILVSAAVIAIDLLLREPVGLGTILDALVVGWALDAFLALDPVPLQTSFPLQLAVLLAGTAISCVGMWLYMKTGLSCGPRDALLVAVGRRFPQVSIGVVNIVLLTAVMAVSWLLGCPPGLGTAITVFGTGPIMDLVFKLVRFEPRSVEHEGLAQTWAALLAALRQERQGVPARK